MTCRSHFHIFHAFFCTEFQAGHLQSTRSFALSVLRRCLCTREAMWKNTDWKSYISANVDVSLHIHSKPTSRNHVPLPCSGIFVHLPKSALTSDLTIGKRPAIGSFWSFTILMSPKVSALRGYSNWDSCTGSTWFEEVAKTVAICSGIQGLGLCFKF